MLDGVMLTCTKTVLSSMLAEEDVLPVVESALAIGPAGLSGKQIRLGERVYQGLFRPRGDWCGKKLVLVSWL